MKLATPCDIDAIDKQLLNALQREIPLISEPFLAMATTLEISVDAVLERIGRLKEEQVIRQMSAIFDTKTLGYKSSLVAMKIAADHIDAAAVVINAHPGVSHNYKRNHEYNLWFTVAVPATGDVRGTIELLHHASGAQQTIILPTLRLYKIGVKLDLTGQEAKQEGPDEIYDEARRQEAMQHQLTEDDVTAIRVLQEDMPLTARPFSAWAAGSDWTEERLLTQAQTLAATGVMRRCAAILHHRNAGFKANAMVVWDVPVARTDEIGTFMATQREISHCYRRPTFPDWPFALFTMIHAPTYSDCMAVVDRIEAHCGVMPHQNLFSTKEYKKIRLKYFMPELDAWGDTHRHIEVSAAAKEHVLSIPVTGLV
jgi:siroheme decarboxylase